MDAPPARDARPPASGLGPILFLSVAYALIYGGTQSVLSRFLADRAIYSDDYWWLFTLAVFPGAALGDRFFGPRRAVIVGAWFAGAASLVALVIAFNADAASAGLVIETKAVVHALLACVAIAVSVLGAGLIRANLAVVLSDWFPQSNGRRYAAFVWFEALTGVGFLLPTAAEQLGGTIELLTVGIVIFAVAAVRFARSAGSHRPLPDGSDTPALSRGGSLRLAALTVAVLPIGGIAIFLNAAQATPLRIGMPVLCLGIPVLLYSKIRRSATGVGQRVDVRGLGVLLVAAFAFFALGDFASTNRYLAGQSVPPVPRAYENLIFLAGTVFAVILGLTWRRLRLSVADGSRIGLSAGFTMVAGTFVLIAAVLALDLNPYLLLTLVAVWEAASMLVSATGLSAVTAMAPAGFASRAVACWHLVVSGAYTAMALAVPIDTEPNPILATAAAASCLWLALVLLPRRAGADADRVVLRRRGLATRVAALAAVGSIGWAVMGRYMKTDVTAFAVATAPRFHGVDRAFLPDDSTLGFVAISGGQAAVGESPTNPAAPRDVSSGTIVVPLSPFSIARYEVTVAQFRACIDEGDCRPADPRATSGEDTSPVRYVTWLEALDYCRWLEKRLAAFSPSLLANGEHVTLPSEAEWEFAAGRGAGVYPWVGPLTPQRANYANSGHLLPASVGEFGAGATADGIQDLSGNVAEWTRSEYRPYPYDRIDGRENMNSTDRPRTIRGGSFYDAATLLKITSRQAADPTRGYDFVGFRTALSTVASTAPPPATGTFR